MKKTKILIVHHRHEYYRDYLEKTEPSLEIDSFDRRDPIPFQSHDAEILMAWKFPDGLLQRLPRLKWIAGPAAGVDHLVGINIPPGVIITKAEATMGLFMAQYILTFIFHRLRKVGLILEQQRAHKWRYVMSDLIQRHTLGILGLGTLGSRVAEAAKALGMTVYGAKKTPVPSPPCDRLFTGGAWREMLPLCDFIVILLPMTPDTDGMIGADELASMKNSAVLINISRGRIIQEAALIETLRNGDIAGVVLDVFIDEPLPADHPFWEMDNVIVTPHCSGPSEEGLICEEFLENYRRWLSGNPLERVVDISRGY
jgi:phosphoglycerate dehydrogenase-like enzyme